MASAQFLDVFEEERNKMKDNTVSMIITRVIILRWKEDHRSYRDKFCSCEKKA